MFSCSRTQGIASIHWRKTEQIRLKAEYQKVRSEIPAIHTRANELSRIHSVTISTFGDFDSAAEKLCIWQEWHDAWLYRIRPRRITPRNYHLPDSIASNNASLLAEPFAPGSDMPRRHSGESIDSDADVVPPVVTEGGPRRESDASESDFTWHSTGGNPDFAQKDKSVGRSTEISDTSETPLPGRDSPSPSSSRRKINK